jgi:hypothetical protein
MKIYLAGPMRGYRLYNFPAFFAAAIQLQECGHIVANPAARDMAVGLDPHLDLDHPENAAVFSLKTAFEWDLMEVMKADAIVLLPGWQESKGAQAELVLAISLHRKAYELIDGELVAITARNYTVTFGD